MADAPTTNTRVRVKPLRLVFASAALTLVATLGASCVDLLELDGYTGAVQSLCDMLAECYGDSFYPKCAERAEQRLGDASPELRESYLTAFADNSCLESCTNARACLDHQPVCNAGGASCGAVEQCCGFTEGSSQCEGGSCCVPRGSACSGEGQCCGDACLEGSCGGVECKTADEACDSDGECCGELKCNPLLRICAICLPDSSECSGPADCCSGYCEFAVTEPAGNGEPPEPAPALGICAPEPCRPDGASCTDPSECCPESPLCVRLPDSNDSVCSVAECVADGDPCINNDECCSTECDAGLGVCTPPVVCAWPGDACSTPLPCCEGDCIVGTCCLGDGLDCVDPSHCCGGKCDANTGFKCAGSSCFADASSCPSDPADCCSGACSGATPGAVCCPSFPNYCSHGICTQGDPLRPSCHADVQNGALDFGGATCVDDVCQFDPFCCCSSWDELCVTEAQALCGVTCVNDPN